MAREDGVRARAVRDSRDDVSEGREGVKEEG